MRTLKNKRQMVIYALSAFGVNLLNLIMGSYLCSALLVGGFKAEVLPFQTYASKDLVVASLWAIFALVAKIIDGIIDIPMASFTDRLKSRFGRRRPSLLIGLIPMILAFLLFLVVPFNGMSVGNTIYYGIVLCVFYTFYTLTMVTYYATFTEIVETQEQRNFISNVKAVVDIVYFIFGYVAVAAFLKGLNVRVVSLICLPLVLTMLIPLFMIKEKSSLEMESTIEKPVKRLGLFKSFTATIKNKSFISWMLVYMFLTFSSQLFLGGINEYFSRVEISMIMVMIFAFLPVPFTIKIFNKIQRNHGFGTAIRYTLFMFAFGMYFLFMISFVQTGTLKTVLSILSGLFTSFAIGSIFSVAYSIPSELAAEEGKNSGTYNSAMYFAVQGLFSGVASGLATGIVLTALKGQQGNEPYLFGFPAIYTMTAICALAAFIGALLSFILPKSVQKIGLKNQE